MITRAYLNDSGEIIEKMKGISAFRCLGREDLRRILQLCKIVQYEPGEFLIEEGSNDNWVFFLLSGKVGIQKEGESIGVLRRTGDLFGEMGVIDGSARSASIVAIEKTVCLALDSSRDKPLEGKQKRALGSILYQAFAQVLASRLRRTNEELVKMKEENAMLKAELKKLKIQGEE